MQGWFGISLPLSRASALAFALDFGFIWDPLSVLGFSCLHRTVMPVEVMLLEAPNRRKSWNLRVQRRLQTANHNQLTQLACGGCTLRLASATSFLLKGCRKAVHRQPTCSCLGSGANRTPANLKLSRGSYAYDTAQQLAWLFHCVCWISFYFGLSIYS